MDLMAEVMGEQEAGRRNKGGGCSVLAFLDEQEGWPLPEGVQRRYTRDEWEQVLDDPRAHPKAIHTVMKRHGYTRSDQMLKRHRAHECACPS